MILIIGGAYQGKRKFAAEKLGIEENKIFYDFHNKVKEYKCDCEKLIDYIKKGGYKAVICNEVGNGVVPVGKGERQWREAVGRGLCMISDECEEIWRVVMGIGMRIK